MQYPGFSNNICYGDYVIIRHPKPSEGYLAADGILFGETYLLNQDENIKSLEECIFEVHVQNQYAALKEYEHAIMFGLKSEELETKDHLQSKLHGPSLHLSKSKKVSKDLHDYKHHHHNRSVDKLQELKTAMLNERRLNEKMMNLKIGKPIVFGDLIQLRHVKSQKFLTVNSYMLAKNERENLRVLVQGGGDSSSSLVPLPRFKTDREGQLITNNAEMFLRVHERIGEYLHLAKKNYVGLAEERKEINCSLDSSVWIMSVYRSAVDRMIPSSICGGQVVSFQDPETLAYMIVDTKTTSSDKGRIGMSNAIGSNTSSNVATESLWVLESDSLMNGGIIKYKQHSYTIRHLNSGWFVALDKDTGTLFSSPTRAEAIRFEFNSNITDFGRLVEDQPVQLSSKGMFVFHSNDATISVPAESSSAAVVTSTVGATASSRLHLTSGDKYSASNFLLSSATRRVYGNDLYVCVEAAHFLRRFLDFARQFSSGDDVSQSPSVVLKMLYSVLENMSAFLSSKTSRFELDELELLHAKNSSILRMRQQLCLEQGFLGVLLLVIEMCGRNKFDALRNKDRMTIIANKHGNIGSLKLPVKGRVGGVHATSSGNQMNLANSENGSAEEYVGDELGHQSVSQQQAHDKGLSPSTVAPSQAKHLALGGLRSTLVSGVNRFKRNSISVFLGLTTGSTSDPNTPAVIPAKGNLLAGHRGVPAAIDLKDVANHATSVKISKELAKNCFEVLFCIVKDNHESQNFVADHLTDLLKQIKDHESAVRVVNELLRDNLVILQTKIREPEIKIFVSLLVEFEMSVTFVKLIQEMCSCPVGVDNTQRLVARALFGPKDTLVAAIGSDNEDSNSGEEDQVYCINDSFNKRPVILQLHSEFVDRTLTKIDWNLASSIYIPSNTALWTQILGHKLLINGYPQVFVSWNCEDNESDFSMLSLFCTNAMVGLEALCHPIKTRAEKTILLGDFANKLKHSFRDTTRGRRQSIVGGDPKRKRNSKLVRTTMVVKRLKAAANLVVGDSPYDRKCQVRDFLICQLYLMADLCLDRNYVSIGILENILDFETLLSILLADRIQHQMKAPVCRIIRCMFVDRDPQVFAMYPRLIRSANTEGTLNESASKDNQYRFCLIQQVISEYIRTEMMATKWNELSAEMMQLLSSLIGFGFYDDVEKLKDILIPLVLTANAHRTAERNAPNVALTSKLLSDNAGIALPQNLLVRRDMTATLPGTEVVESGDDEFLEDNADMQDSVEKILQETVEEDYQAKPSIVSAWFERVNPKNFYLSCRTFWKRLQSIGHGELDDDTTDEELQWFERWYVLTGRMDYLLIVLLAVVACIVVVFLELFDPSGSSPVYHYIDIAVAIFFGVELLLRWYCHYRVKENAMSFYSELFNVMDAVLVVLDVVVLVVEAAVGHVTSSSYGRVAKLSRGIKSIRVVRFLRFLRILRAARLLKRMSEASNASIPRTLSSKYSKISQQEVQTMVGILRTVSMLYDRIQDHNLDIVVKAFSIWFDQDNPLLMGSTDVSRLSPSGPLKTPVQVYKEVCAAEVDLSHDIPPCLDLVLLDNIMHVDRGLVQASLNLLMVHKSRDYALLQVAGKLQLLYSLQASKYQEMSTMLTELKRHVEKFEIWGELSTVDDDNTASRVISLLTSLIDFVRIPHDNQSLSIPTIYKPDKEVQLLLVNLNAFPVLINLQETLFDGGREDPIPKVHAILKLSNDLIHWLIKGSPANQAIAFEFLNWFVEKIDCGVNSSAVIGAIFEANADLILDCPKSYFIEMMDNISLNGRLPQYLDLFVGLLIASKEKECRVLSVEREISTEWRKKVLLWCEGPDGPSSAARAAEMAHVQRKNKTIQDEDLTINLKYYVRVLKLISSCNLGPKLQAIFPCEDLLRTLIDPASISPVKYALAELFLEIVVTGLDTLQYLESFWIFLETIISDLRQIDESMKVLFVDPSSTAALRVERGNWTKICLQIVLSFFMEFDLVLFTPEDIDFSGNDYTPTNRGRGNVVEIIEQLFVAVHTLSTKDARFMGHQLLDLINLVKDCLLMHAPHIATLFNLDGDTKIPPGDSMPQNRARRGRRNTKVKLDLNTINEVHEIKYRSHYFEFLASITASVGTSTLCSSMVELVESVPLIADNVVSDYRFEHLMRKLSSHIILEMKKSNANRYADKTSVDTSVWLLQCLRALIEKYTGVTVSPNGALPHYISENSEKADLYRKIYNENGVTFMCLELINTSVQKSLVHEAMKLLSILLWKKGGDRGVQKSVHSYLYDTDSSAFFEQVNDNMDNLINWLKKDAELGTSQTAQHKAHTHEAGDKHGVQHGLHSNLGVADVPHEVKDVSEINFEKVRKQKLSVSESLPEEFAVFTLLSFINEGDYMPTKNFLREQTGNSKLYNIFESIASFLDFASRREQSTPALTKAVNRVLPVVYKLLRGPCFGSQERFIIHTELLVSLNRLMRQARPNASTSLLSFSAMEEWNADIDMQREWVLDLLLASIEGHGYLSVVFERVANTTEINLFSAQLLPELDSGSQNLAVVAEFVDNYPVTATQAKYILFLEYLGEYAGAWPAFAQAQRRDSASVEVVTTAGSIERVNFRIPPLAKTIAKSSLASITSDIDAPSQDLILMELTTRTRKLYKEAKHQEYLSSFGFSHFNGIIDRMRWLMFLNACLINMLILGYYEVIANSHDLVSAAHRLLTEPMSTLAAAVANDYLVRKELHFPTTAGHAVTLLTIFQIFIACVTLAVILLIRVPVQYQFSIESGLRQVDAIANIFQDSFTAWYGIYLAIAVIGLLENRLFLSLLLLDLANLDSTTQHLLMAIKNPARQLVSTLLMLIITMNIFVCVVFYYYLDDIVKHNIDSLWEAFRMGLTRGTRGEYGFSTELTGTLSNRIILDVLYYFTVLAILREVFFAIIIDTFGQLRNNKNERDMHANNSCFICGIDRHDFEQIRSETSGSFAQHREMVHNVQHYIFFMIDIWERAEEDDTGIQLEVRNKLLQKNISWIPVGLYSSKSSLAGSDVPLPQGHTQGHMGKQFAAQGDIHRFTGSETSPGGHGHGPQSPQPSQNYHSVESNSKYHHSSGKSAKAQETIEYLTRITNELDHLTSIQNISSDTNLDSSGPMSTKMPPMVAINDVKPSSTSAVNAGFGGQPEILSPIPESKPELSEVEIKAISNLDAQINSATNALQRILERMQTLESQQAEVKQKREASKAAKKLMLEGVQPQQTQLAGDLGSTSQVIHVESKDSGALNVAHEVKVNMTVTGPPTDRPQQKFPLKARTSRTAAKPSAVLNNLFKDFQI